MEERYERIDRGEAMDLLARIARDGRSSGVHLVVTAQRRAEVPVAVAGSLSARLVLRCATVDDATMLGLDDAAASGDLPPGRCRMDGHTAQVALPPAVSPADEVRTGGSVAAAVPRLPVLVRRDELRASAPDAGLLAVGLDGDTLSTVHLDLRHHHAVVAGPPRCGVSTTLRSVVAAHPHGQLLVRPAPDELGAAVATAVDAAGAGRPSLVAVDDVPDLLDGPDAERVAALFGDLVRAGRDHPVRLVLGGEVDAMARCYHEVVATVRRGRTGVLLGGDPELHGVLLHASLQQRSDLPSAPGRGWVLGPGTARRVQVAVAD
jgi:S-DNA-T family DNA segregation ATPase FtsK/SpoIIIE